MIQRYPFHGGVTYVDDEAGLTSVGYYPAYETELIARKYGLFRSLVDELGLWSELHNMEKVKLWNGQINSPYDHQNHKLSNITNADDLKIGQWATWCCHQDLEQIDANLLEQIREDFINPDPWPIWKVWNTRKEALEDILFGWPENSDEYREIVEMLQEEEEEEEENTP